MCGYCVQLIRRPFTLLLRKIESRKKNIFAGKNSFEVKKSDEDKGTTWPVENPNMKKNWPKDLYV